jgi:CRP/FNR family cyclic AMP-dependent transcriptional regulator
MAGQKLNIHQPDVEILRHIPLFKGLSTAQLEAIVPLLRRKNYPARYVLMSQQELGDVIYLLIRGTVKVYIERPLTADVILAICGAGEVLGELNAIDEMGHTANVETLEPSTLFVVNRHEFRQCLDTMPQLTLNIASNTIRRLRTATMQIQSLARQDVYSRVACQLVSFAEQYGEPCSDGTIFIPLRLTQSNLADLIGASRVRVNQVLNSFKRSRFISVDSSYRITIVNSEALHKRCEKDYNRLDIRHTS